MSLADKMHELEMAGVKVMDIEVPCQGSGCTATVATTSNEWAGLHSLAYDAFDEAGGCGEKFLCADCDQASRKQDYDEARAEDAAEAARELASESVTFNVA